MFGLIAQYYDTGENVGRYEEINHNSRCPDPYIFTCTISPSSVTFIKVNGGVVYADLE